MKLRLSPISFKEACIFISKYHRHHLPPQGHKFSISVIDETGEIHGVVCVGRPISRHQDNGTTLEVTRSCTDGTPNVNSMLYGAAWRVTRNLGYTKLITYTLVSEPGTSLKAAGFKCVGECQGGSWSRVERKRIDKHPLGQKNLWMKHRNPRG